MYSSLEEKSANLLYLIIKNHGFVDGNKRIGSILFVYYLAKNNFLHRSNGEIKINEGDTELGILTLKLLSNQSGFSFDTSNISNFIVEGNHWGDTYWGYDPTKKEGLNYMGRILMAIRDKIKNVNNNVV